MTTSEVWLWRRLRGGVPRFRRQQPMGPYILDFYCAAAGLAVEVDGGVHRQDGQAEHDAIRDHWLREQGVKMLRVSVDEVVADPDRVAERVRNLALSLAPPR